MAKKVDLTQPQADVLEELLVEGPKRSRYGFHPGTTKALHKRGYIKGASVYEITVRGTDTLRRFPYADKHIGLIVEWTVDDALKCQDWGSRAGVHKTRIQYKVQWLGKVNAALDNGQPPTPKKPKPVTPPAQKSERAAISRIAHCLVEIAATEQAISSNPMGLNCSHLITFINDLQSEILRNVYRLKRADPSEPTPVKPKPVRKAPVGKWELFMRQSGVCPVCEKRMQYGSTLQVHDHHAVVYRGDLPIKQQKERDINDPLNRVALHAACHNKIQRDRQWGINYAIGEHGESAVKAMCQRLLPKTWRNLYKWSAS